MHKVKFGENFNLFITLKLISLVILILLN